MSEKKFLDQNGLDYFWEKIKSKFISSFNGRTGAVMPQTGDYTAAMVGAIKDYSTFKLYGDIFYTIINTPGWYRVCIDKTKQVGTSAIFFLGHGYSSGSPSDMLVYVNFKRYNPEIVILSNPTTINGRFPVDNLRLTYDESKRMYFLDVHYTLSVGNAFSVNCIASSLEVTNPVSYEFPELVLVADAPEGEQILTYAGWVSPPMKLGVEYRTSEMYNGKPVYKIAWPLGAFPNNTSKVVEVDTGTPGTLKAIRHNVTLDVSGTQANGMYGESIFSETNYLGVFLQNGDGKFAVGLGSKRNVDQNATIFIDYVRG